MRNQIESIEESRACRDAMERLAECGWSLEDEGDNHALALMWMAGVDWQRDAAVNAEAALRAEAARLRAAIESALSDYERRDETSMYDTLVAALRADRQGTGEGSEA